MREPNRHFMLDRASALCHRVDRGIDMSVRSSDLYDIPYLRVERSVTRPCANVDLEHALIHADIADLSDCSILIRELDLT